jgi:hypothetical protein
VAIRVRAAQIAAAQSAVPLAIAVWATWNVSFRWLP